jgi:hypothetical protein
VLQAAVAGLALLSAPAVAQKGPVNGTAQPARGTSQRQAILDALRPAIEAQLGPNIVFEIKVLRVEKGWAFVVAEPFRKGGGYVNQKAYLPDWEQRDGITVTAVLRYEKGWTLVQQQIGATGVWYCEIGPSSLKRGHGCK